MALSSTNSRLLGRDIPLRAAQPTLHHYGSNEIKHANVLPVRIVHMLHTTNTIANTTTRRTITSRTTGNSNSLKSTTITTQSSGTHYPSITFITTIIQNNNNINNSNTTRQVPVL